MRVNLLENIKCPVCESKKLKNIFIINNINSAYHFGVTGGWKSFNKIRFSKLAKHIEQLWGTSKCRVFMCINCGFSFSHPFVSGNPEFYRLAFNPGYPDTRWEFDLALDSITKTKNYKKLNYLEIGSGPGNFVKKLLLENIDKKNIVATEYSRPCRDELKKIGIKSTVKLPNKKFDVICCFQVLEHMSNPVDFFNNIKKIANPNTKVFISVPNPRSVRLSEKYGGILDMPPNHVCEYTYKSLKIILGGKWTIKRHLFENESTKKMQDKISHYNYLQRLIGLLSNQPVKKRHPLNSIFRFFDLTLSRRIGTTQFFELENI